MSIHNISRRIVAAFAAISVIFSCFGTVSIADEISMFKVNDDAALIFDGFEMRYNN